MLMVCLSEHLSFTGVTMAFLSPTRLGWSRDSAVGIATGYRLDDRGIEVRVPVGSRIFSSPHRSHRLWGPPSFLYNGYWGLFPPGVKQQGREADHSPPASAEVKKKWIYTSTPPYAFMELYLLLDWDSISIMPSSQILFNSLLTNHSTI
jgi:hypothetical protein